MALAGSAQRRRAALFGEHESGLEHTDPEFAQYLQNFAFGEVPDDVEALDAGVDRHLRLLAQLAATVAVGGAGVFRATATAGLRSSVITAVELKEVVYQAVPYVGMARTYEFVRITNDILTENGVDLPLPGQSTTDPGSRMKGGTAVQKRIVGDETVDTMYANAKPDTAHFQRYLSGNCFGDTVARSGLDVATRELLTFAMLAALGGAEAQVRGHVNGNVNVGNDRSRLLAVLTAVAPLIGYPRTLNALAVVEDVTGG